MVGDARQLVQRAGDAPGPCVTMGPVEITFRQDGTLGAGRYTSVLVGDRMVGRIFHTGGIHRFYEGHDAKRAALQTTDLDQLKTALRARYAAR